MNLRPTILTALLPISALAALTAPTGIADAAALPDGWTQLTDETGTITVGVPATWSQYNTAPSLGMGEPTPQIAASADVTAFSDTFDVSGVLYQAMPHSDMPTDMTIEMMGGMFADRGCAAPVVQPYDDGTFVGTHGAFTGCAGGSSEYHILSANRSDQAFSALVMISVVAPDPAGTAEQILGTLALAPGAPSTSNATVPTVPPPTTLPAFPAPSGVAPAGWTPLVDQTNAVQIAVPPTWTDVSLAPSGDSPNINAAPDLEAILSDSGAYVTVNTFEYSEHTEALATLSYYSDLCATKATNSFDNGAVAGHITTYSECGATGLTVYRVLANSPANTTYSLGVTIAIAGGADDAAVLDGLLSTARFVG